MAKKDDGLVLSLSLSLKCPENPNHFAPPPPPPVAPPQPPSAAAPFPFNFTRAPLSFMQHLQNKSSTYGAFQSFSDRNAESSALFRGIDMNRAATVMEGDEEVNVVSSPNSSVSSLSGKRSEREENDGERGSSSLEMDEDGGGDASGRKKLRLTKEQGIVLEEAFKVHNTLNPKQKMALAKRLNLRPRQVEVWFQNRRARTKLKQTEVDCEYLRRCCENLREENRRVQKEVNELRALKLSPQLYMNMSPPTTLTMCPQCQRVSSSSPIAPTFNRQVPHHHRPRPMTPPWATIIPSQPLD